VRTPLRAAAVALAVATLLARPALADRVADLTRALTSDPDFKVRLTAAMVLGKLRDRRAEPALLEGLSDRNETVRGMSASALGKLGDPEAAPALERLSRDRSDFVRGAAREALLLLKPPPSAPPSSRKIGLALGAVHNKSAYGGPRIADHLRETLIHEIADVPALAVVDEQGAGYVIESTIKQLNHRTTDHWVEVDCELSFIVAKLPSHGIVGTTSGGATVQVPKLSYHPAKQDLYFAEAMENAVRGAHPSLVELLDRLQKAR
jgi:HEAT repeat protein